MTDTCKFDGRPHNWDDCPFNPEAPNVAQPSLIGGTGEWDIVVRDAADYILGLIDADIAAGVGGSHGPIPWDVTDFADLHLHVDANDYLIDWHIKARVYFDANDEAACHLDNEILDAVSARLQERNDGLEAVYEYSCDDGRCVIYEVPWLPESKRFVMDYGWSSPEFFANKASAVIRLGLLIACDTDIVPDCTGFYIHGNDKAAEAIDTFIRAEVQ